jgi:pantoate--beta-alanine ligase
MGWLHEGHRALMRQARATDATTVVTIFVNPRQFTVADDYTQYPRNEARDVAIAETEGVDIVFAPDAAEVYPPGFDTVVVGRRGREAARGCRAPRSFRRRRDRRRHPVRPVSARTTRISGRRTPSR